MIINIALKCSMLHFLHNYLISSGWPLGTASAIRKTTLLINKYVSMTEIKDHYPTAQLSPRTAHLMFIGLRAKNAPQRSWFCFIFYEVKNKPACNVVASPVTSVRKTHKNRCQAEKASSVETSTPDSHKVVPDLALFSDLFRSGKLCLQIYKKRLWLLTAAILSTQQSCQHPKQK